MRQLGAGRVPAHSVTGLVLAGGRGSRMGGLDKGQQPFQGHPLAWHALRRLQQQQGPRLAGCLLNANRHLDAYAALGVPVLSDTLADFAGPLAGFLAGLTHCPTPYLLTVPCDSPLYPLDLLERLAQALEAADADIAMASAPDADGQLHHQPVFCLLKVSLRDSLIRFTQEGGRKIGAWAAQHTTVKVPFNLPHDDPLAFSNANTLVDLHALEQDAR